MSDQTGHSSHAADDGPIDYDLPEGLGVEVTLALQSVRRGDPRGSEQLLEAVYDQLRALARARLKREADAGAGFTLDATALVHEAYLRITGPDQTGQNDKSWDSRAHFFGAAALAMRRILVERARHRRSQRHGGRHERVALTDNLPAATNDESADGMDLLALDDARQKLERLDPRKAQVVSLRYFAGLSVEETADALDLSPATVKNDWSFARAWLHRELSGD